MQKGGLWALGRFCNLCCGWDCTVMIQSDRLLCPGALANTCSSAHVSSGLAANDLTFDDCAWAANDLGASQGSHAAAMEANKGP